MRPPSKSLECSVCQQVRVAVPASSLELHGNSVRGSQVLTDPMVLPGCGHTFCRSCIARCFKHKRQCPTCRDEQPPPDERPPVPNITLRHIVDELQVRSPLVADPCL